MLFTHAIEVRYNDLDTLNHVNNAVLVSFLEQARWKWWHGFLGSRAFEEEGFLVARIEVDYREPILMGDDVRVEVGCVRVGNTSFELAYRVTRGPGGPLLAEARTVQVMLDFKTQKPTPVSDEARAWMMPMV